MTKPIRTCLAGFGLAAVLATGAWAQGIPAEVPTAAQPKPSSSEIWEQIKKGKEGRVAQPVSTETLIKQPIPGCTEKAVGFTTPVHANFPLVEERRGEGPTMQAMGLLAAIFGLCFGAGAMLARNLGRHGA